MLLLVRASSLCAAVIATGSHLRHLGRHSISDALPVGRHRGDHESRLLLRCEGAQVHLVQLLAQAAPLTKAQRHSVLQAKRVSQQEATRACAAEGARRGQARVGTSKPYEGMPAMRRMFCRY